MNLSTSVTLEPNGYAVWAVRGEAAELIACRIKDRGTAVTQARKLANDLAGEAGPDFIAVRQGVE